MTVVVPAGSDVVIADTLVVFVTYLLTYLQLAKLKNNYVRNEGEMPVPVALLVVSRYGDRIVWV